MSSWKDVSRNREGYLMAIHKHLPKSIRRDLREVCWTKAVGLAKVARSDPQHFDCATWLHKAKNLPKEEFEQEIERCLNGPDSEPCEIIYFKLYKSQLPVIEQAMETAAGMLGSDRSRGYCLEMICTDFLAEANLGGVNSEILVNALYRCFSLMPHAQQTEFLQRLRAAA
jgi:hypothetical protein